LSILQPAKVAIPPVAVTGLLVQPLSVPLLGFVPIDSVTVVVLSLRTTLLFTSSTFTTGWVPNALPPLIVPPGCVVNTTLVAGPKIATAEPGFVAVVSVVVLTAKPDAA
jgi:hypothetical protein